MKRAHPATHTHFLSSFRHIFSFYLGNGSKVCVCTQDTESRVLSGDAAERPHEGVGIKSISKMCLFVVRVLTTIFSALIRF